MRRIRLLKEKFYLLRFKMRHLRSYTSVANTSHFCDNCCRYIQPGEQYEGTVSSTDKHGIIVSKKHVNPGCDWPHDEFEDILSKSNDLENLAKEDESLNVAA
jgi:hypothetical protein